MFNEIKIGSKITALLLAVVLLSVFAISFLSYRLSKDSIEERYWESLKVMSSLKASQLEAIFQQVEYNIDLIRESGRVIESLEAANRSRLADSIYLSVARKLDAYLYPIQEIYQYKNILLIDREGKVIYRTNKNQTDILEGEIFGDYEQIRIHANEGIYFGSLNLYANNKERAYMTVSAPIYSNDNQLIGYVVTEFNMDKIYDIVNENTGLRQTGEMILARLSGNKIEFINKPRNSQYSLLTYSVLTQDKNSEALEKAVKKMTGYGFAKDYRDKVTLSNWTYLPTVGWGLVVKIDEDEINQDLNYLVIAFVLSGCFIVIISFTVSYLFSKFLTQPLISLRNTLNVVAMGILPESVKKESNDEIGEMAIATAGLVAALRRTANFAHRIGEGDYDADFKPMSENDTLGNALITMRDSIQLAEKKDDERNWIISGVAEIGQILRSHNRIDELADAVIAYITETVKAVQGALYIVNEQDGEKIIELQASYAYSKKKYLKASFRFAEGLIGQAAIEEDTILRTEIPDEYVTITSGLLGDRKPKCLLIVPLIIDDIVHGVVELAGFEKFNPVQIKFVEEISVSIARTISNIKVNERTIMLLQESQQMSEELQLQQEVLRQNAEEMQATQEELRRINARLEEQIMEVKRTQKTMQVLLENASEVITIYESDGKVRYISPSVTPILGYTPEEMIGVNDIIHVHPNSAELYQNMFNQLLELPEQQVTVQFEYKKKNGDTIWLEATGNNLLSDPAINGIVINSRDITERRRAEREARMRGQMQALSENSPDLITRLNLEGTVFYINPVIRNLTGLVPEGFVGKTIYETDLNPQILDNWTQIIKQVSETKSKAKMEMTFPSIYGERTMQVNAIPEYNEKKELESILVVSNDITERKEAELEILSVNKKITESINYSKRIQSAIIPETKHIQQFLPNSFIYYKPRDVVSGDFPWFAHQGENILYIAAVDCTGHGVPGALISLIGYFILNDIVSKHEDISAGEVLDLLDQGVTKTLRQEDMDSSTRDGMDIGLCKINLRKKEFEYAGAHRPLYLVQNKELVEIKGDRFPIGGGQHKKRTNFTTTKLGYNQGDQLYLFSDGLPDQFGGMGNSLMKYSPRKLREVIMENQGIEMNEMHQKIDESFENWKGNRKQTDDILLIGIKF